MKEVYKGADASGKAHGLIHTSSESVSEIHLSLPYTAACGC